jgi:hypothetical protein
VERYQPDASLHNPLLDDWQHVEDVLASLAYLQFHFQSSDLQDVSP